MNDEFEIEMTNHRYPSAIVRSLKSPATLYVRGNPDLLALPAIGICGSRSASDSALRYAAQFGAEAARAGFVVVSGHAKGIDRAAHRGAMEVGGATIAVTPEGLGHFRLARELRDLVDEKNFAAVSQFRPRESWAVYRAMQRNRYLVGLSRALVVIEAHEKGGTLEAGLECLRQRKPLWVIDYATDESGREGNRALMERGGTPIKNTRQLKAILQEDCLRNPLAMESQEPLAL